MRQRKAANAIDPLDVVVRRVKGMKKEANTYVGPWAKLMAGCTARARTSLLSGYLACLWDLLPWYASPITLTANVYFDSGLAEL